MAISAKSKILASDISNALAGKQNNLGFTPVQQAGGANQTGNKVYIGWDGSALRCQVDNLDLGHIITNLAGQTQAPLANWANGCETANYAHSAGRAFPKKTDGGDLNMNWHDHGGHPSYLWGGDDGANMYVFPPSRLSVNYANSAGWANSASATTVPNFTAVVNNYATLPSGGTWRCIRLIFSDSRITMTDMAGGSKYNSPAFAIRIA